MTLFTRTLAAVCACIVLLGAAGCGNDEAPPDDPNYYKGPMKPKSAQPGTDSGQ
jgi:hypothetical protein